jgi:tRNA threonylcarbamoyl adenosine modification protein YeaZ
MENGQVVYEHVNDDTAVNRQDISRFLLPEIDKGIASAGWSKADIDCIVVGQGPGSFTGIRSSVVTARTLAQALDLPCLGISLFDCYAQRLPMPADIVLKAGLQQVFHAAYGKGPEPVLTQEPTFLPVSELSQVMSATCGHYIEPSLQEALIEPSCQVLPGLGNIATSQAKIAESKLSLSGAESNRDRLKEKFSWQVVEPLYVRNPSVTVGKNNGNTH